jgi:hypothetical protein
MGIFQDVHIPTMNRHAGRGPWPFRLQYGFHLAIRPDLDVAMATGCGGVNGSVRADSQTSGSERAFDVYMKARYLDELHPGHGVTFATGTSACA